MCTTDLFYVPEYYLYIFRVLQLGIACYIDNLQTTTQNMSIIYHL